MPHFQKHINILIMPTDSCNMDCVYCFHKPHQNSVELMSIDTVKRLLNITVPYYERLNIIWHGGEPLLMGLDFYKKVVDLQKQFNITIKNSIQTNLTLLTSDMADFFVENNFDISGSYDGVTNNKSRGHDSEILAGRQLMIDRGKRCGLIMVVSNYNINNLIDSYNLFKKLDINVSLNLYLDQKDNHKAGLQLDEKTTVLKLQELFDYWLNDKSGNIHISYFKHILHYILSKKKSLCTFTSCLGRWIGVRHNGDIVPCNRFFTKEYTYGNVFNYDDIGKAFESEGFKLLLTQAIRRREKCKSCKIYDFCCGGCNNNAFNENGIENNGGFGCKVLIDMYTYIEHKINEILMDRCNVDRYNPMLLKMLQESKRE